MALAIGVGLNRLFSLNLTVAQIAAATMRGKRSGIGIGAFTHGGFLVDAGKYADKQGDDIPAIAARHAFPSDWRVLLVLDNAHKGVHGAVEMQAFQTLAPAKSALRSMVFEHMLPALQRSDLLTFGEHMQTLQTYNGDYFEPIQGGRYASKDVAEVLVWLQNNGVVCFGQSSWGPTGFAILENQQQAESLQAQARLVFAGKSNISFKIVQGKNTGASISAADISEMSILESE
jgi:beta-ribofuranosylaminobenzene 5'-phosphate synthase